MSSKVVNLSYIEEVCGGSKEIMKEMIDIFFVQIDEFNQEMKELLAEGKYHDLGLLAHKAKSSIAIMGMDYLAERLKKFELSAKEGSDIDSYQGYVDEFKQLTSDAIAELNIYLNSTV